MKLNVQKRLAAQIMKCSPKRVIFDSNRLEDIKQAITKRDLKLLIGDKAITEKPMAGTARVHARKIQSQKRKGRRKGAGSRKGTFNSRFNTKQTWIATVRVQRAFLKELVTKNIITRLAYRELYLKSKGGYFRSKRHIKLYLEEHDEMLASSTGSKPSGAGAAEAKPEKKTRSKKADAQ